MATTVGQPARRGLPTATRARLVLGGVVATVVVLAELSFLAYGEGKNAILTVAKFVGLHAALLMMLQVTLIARVPWFDRRIGMDRLTVWHRWIGITLAWTVVTHATLIVLGYAALGDETVGDTFLALAGVPATLLGMSAATIVVLLVLASLRRVRRRLSYEAWHAVHVGLYLAVGLALIHQFLEPASFKRSPVTTAFWAATWAVVLGTLLVNRFAVPLWRNARHQYRVDKVVPESDNVVSVYVAGRDLDRLPARAGQFMIWRFPHHNGWWQANPWSLSAAPTARQLRLTAKAVGVTSASLRQLQAGARVFAEGPYGAFTALQRTGTGMLLVAGGVGITPIRALLEESAQQRAGGGFEPDGTAEPPPVVLYRARSETDAVLLDELRSLAEIQGADMHLLTGHAEPGSPRPATSPFDPEPLLGLVPDIRTRDVFVCGPPPMTAAVLRSLRELGVPRAQVHYERFSLA